MFENAADSSLLDIVFPYLHGVWRVIGISLHPHNIYLLLKVPVPIKYTMKWLNTTLYEGEEPRGGVKVDVNTTAIKQNLEVCLWQQ